MRIFLYERYILVEMYDLNYIESILYQLQPDQYIYLNRIVWDIHYLIKTNMGYHYLGNVDFHLFNPVQQFRFVENVLDETYFLRFLFEPTWNNSFFYRLWFGKTWSDYDLGKFTEVIGCASDMIDLFSGCYPLPNGFYYFQQNKFLYYSDFIYFENDASLQYFKYLLDIGQNFCNDVFILPREEVYEVIDDVDRRWEFLMIYQDYVLNEVFFVDIYENFIFWDFISDIFFIDDIWFLSFLIGSKTIIFNHCYWIFYIFNVLIFIYFFLIFHFIYFTKVVVSNVLYNETNLQNFFLKRRFVSFYLRYHFFYLGFIWDWKTYYRYQHEYAIISRRHLDPNVYMLFFQFIIKPSFIFYYYNYFKNYKWYYNYLQNLVFGSKEITFTTVLVFYFYWCFNLPFFFFKFIKTCYFYVYYFFFVILNLKFLKIKTYMPFINTYFFVHYFEKNIIYERDAIRFDAQEVIQRFTKYYSEFKHKKKDILAERKAEIKRMYDNNLFKTRNRSLREYYRFFIKDYWDKYNPISEFFSIHFWRCYVNKMFNFDFVFNPANYYISSVDTIFNNIVNPIYLRRKSSYIFNFYHLMIYIKSRFFMFYFLYYYWMILSDSNFFFLYLNYFRLFFYFLKKNIFIMWDFFYKKKKFVLFNCIIINVHEYLYNYYFLYKIVYIFLLIQGLFFIFFFRVFKFFFFILFEKIYAFFKYFYKYKYIDKFNLSKYCSDNFLFNYYMFIFYIYEYGIFFRVLYFIYKVIKYFFLFGLCFYIFFFYVILNDYVGHVVMGIIPDLIFQGSEFISYKFVNYMNSINNPTVIWNWDHSSYFFIFIEGKFSGESFFLEHFIRGDYFIDADYYVPNVDFRYYKLYYTNIIRRWMKNFPVLNSFIKLYITSKPWIVWTIVIHFWYIFRIPYGLAWLPDHIWNLLPLKITYWYTFFYFNFSNEYMLKILWFWNYFYSYLLYNTLYYFHDTFFYVIIFYWFKIWFNIYTFFRYLVYFFIYYIYSYFTFHELYLKMQFFFKEFDSYYNIYGLIKRYPSICRIVLIIDLLELTNFGFKFFKLFWFEIFGEFFYFIFEYLISFIKLMGFGTLTDYKLYTWMFARFFNDNIFFWITDHFYFDKDFREYGDIFSDHVIGQLPRRWDQERKIRRQVFTVQDFLELMRTTGFEYHFRKFINLKPSIRYTTLRDMGFWNHAKYSLAFFSLVSWWIHYACILTILTMLYGKLYTVYKDPQPVPFSAFFEWDRFRADNKYRLGTGDYYWLLNRRWVDKFQFYYDKHFKDDLYMTIHRGDTQSFGDYVYEKLFVYFGSNKELRTLFKENIFMQLQLYYMERYSIMIKAISILFDNYNISKENSQRKVFSLYNWFFPKKDNCDMDFEDLKKLGYNRGKFWGVHGLDMLFKSVTFGMSLGFNDETKVDGSIDFFDAANKSLYKAYSIFERNQLELKYDLYEFAHFEKEFYDELLLIPDDDEYYPVLGALAHSRRETEMVYSSPGKTFQTFYVNFDAYWRILKNVEYFFLSLRKVNEVYCNKFFNFDINTFIDPVLPIRTHISLEMIIDSINLSENDDPAGLRYSEVHKFEDAGPIYMEEYVFERLQTYFYKKEYGDDISIVALSDNEEDTVKIMTGWHGLLFWIPVSMIHEEICMNFHNMKLSHQYLILQMIEVLLWTLNQFLSYYQVLGYFGFEYWFEEKWLSECRAEDPGTYLREYMFELIQTIKYDLSFTRAPVHFKNYKMMHNWEFIMYQNDLRLGDVRWDDSIFNNFYFSDFSGFYTVLYLYFFGYFLYFISILILFICILTLKYKCWDWYCYFVDTMFTDIEQIKKHFEEDKKRKQKYAEFNAFAIKLDQVWVFNDKWHKKPNLWNE